MPEFVDVVVNDSAQQGGAPVAEVSARDGGKPTPAAKPSRRDAPVDKLKIAADTHAVVNVGRALKDSTREKIEAIVKAHAEDRAAADEADDEAGEEPAVEVEDAADTVEATEDADDDPIDALAEPTEKPAAKAKAEPAPDVDERLKELEGIAERQRAAIERYEKQLAEASKASEETSAQRAARLDAAEAEYLSDPIKAIHKWVATSIGHDDENHDDVKKEVLDLFLDLTAHVSGATQDSAHQAKRENARTRREWEREKKSRAAGGKKDAEAAAKREREQVVEGIVGDIDGRIKPDAEKYPHLTALAPLLDGKSAGRVIWEVIERGVARGDYKADEPDDVLIAKAAKASEAHYTKRADPLRAAITKPSTASTPTATKVAPAAQVEREKPRTSKEARVTNADASVAPAAPPAAKPAPKVIPLQNDEQRRKHALRHLRKK